MSAAAQEEAIVRVRDLTIGWPGVVLLQGASFDVRRGEIFAILGRSGSGKSTLLRHLVGLAAPLAGTIAVLGAPPTLERHGPPPFGVTFQSGALLGSMTVCENVALPLRRWTRLDPSTIDFLSRAKLHVVGLDSAADRTPAEISGGMRTRAAIARAMALEPQLLFLDEPTSGLDPIASVELDDLLVVLNRTTGVTCVLVTHQLPTLFRIVGRCLLLDRASQSIIASGDPHDLRDHSPDPRVRAFLDPSTASPER